MNLLSKLLDGAMLRYQLHGLLNSLSSRVCPACSGTSSRFASRKGFHSLYECNQCSLLFRHPRETADEMTDFYQRDYSEKDITTELPSDQALSMLIASGFRGSAKDFSYHISILQALGIRPGMRVLDFGASWGYHSFQLKQSGYEVESFEISRPRAEFGARMGIDIKTEEREIQGQFDCVYSSHVLEHIANPASALAWQFSVLRSGGLLVAHTPNGSESWRNGKPRHFRKAWGLVHPVLLSSEFIARQFPNYPFLVSSRDEPEYVRSWDQSKQWSDSCDGSSLFLAVRKSKLSD